MMLLLLLIMMMLFDDDDDDDVVVVVVVLYAYFTVCSVKRYAGSWLDWSEKNPDKTEKLD